MITGEVFMTKIKVEFRDSAGRDWVSGHEIQRFAEAIRIGANPPPLVYLIDTGDVENSEGPAITKSTTVCKEGASRELPVTTLPEATLRQELQNEFGNTAVNVVYHTEENIFYVSIDLSAAPSPAGVS